MAALPLADIAKGTSLKPTETADKSAPVIDKDTKIGQSPFQAVTAEIQAGPGGLKPTETNDKSAPVIDSEAKIGKSPHASLFEEIKSTGN